MTFRTFTMLAIGMLIGWNLVLQWRIAAQSRKIAAAYAMMATTTESGAATAKLLADFSKQQAEMDGHIAQFMETQNAINASQGRIDNNVNRSILAIVGAQ